MSYPITPQVNAEQALNAEVARWVGKGYGVESTSPGQVVLMKRKRVGLFWNVVLSIITGGLWLIWVLYRVINRKTDRVVLYVDASGAVKRR